VPLQRRILFCSGAGAVSLCEAIFLLFVLNFPNEKQENSAGHDRAWIRHIQAGWYSGSCDRADPGVDLLDRAEERI
jgi:hypothetical protein